MTSSAATKTFEELGLSAETLAAIADLGYKIPSPIQAQTVPELLAGRDVIGQAQTGTGKTAAFGLPMIEYIDVSVPEVQALVLTPTRELCIQVTQALRAYGAKKGVSVVAVFGGAPILSQIAQLGSGAQVVVGTVGRVRDLISRHALVLHDCRYVVLDEADEMLDLGFLEDVEEILKKAPSGRQTALFSATMPEQIERLADRYLYEPAVVQVKAQTLTVDSVEQFAIKATPREKAGLLTRVLKAERPEQAIIFVRTKLRCERLYRELDAKGIKAKALHGDMSQGARDGVMISFARGSVPILVATDVASRGLDISGVSHVINFDIPNTPDIYVHRIGRTGRASRTGRAITFVEPEQHAELKAIEAHTKRSVTEWVEGAKAEPAKVTAKPPRHSKPQLKPASSAGGYAKLVVGSGSAKGLQVAGLVHEITSRTGLDGESVRNVKLLERFTFVEVPAASVNQVIDELASAGLQADRIT